MYSAWWRPKDRDSTIETDHDALHRDAATHQALQSDEKTILRSLDIETIMSSKKSVKYWYLHRPKTMAFVHRQVVKIQSLVRRYVVRKLIKRHGVAFMVNIAILHDEKREEARLADMTEEERKKDYEEHLKYEATIAEKRRLCHENKFMAIEEDLSMKENHSYKLYRAECNERIFMSKEEHLSQKVEEFIILEAKRKKEEEKILAIKKLEEEKKRIEEEAIKQKEEAIKQKEEEMKQQMIQMELAAKAAREEAEKLQEAKIKAEKEMELDAAYENSLGKYVPVTTQQGRGIIMSYNYQEKQYEIQLEKNELNKLGGLSINTFSEREIELDDERILSPRTQVETPFGLGEIIGLDPHAGCYAIENEHGPSTFAYVQIPNVKVYQPSPMSITVEDEPIKEDKNGKKITEDKKKIPDEIRLTDCRIIDYRIFSRTGKKYIQYKLEIETSNYGKLICWKRYSTFRTLCERLHKEKGFKKKEIPVLPSRHILGNFSQKTIEERADRLNQFLHAAVHADHLQWGIHVDENISVYKRRVKRSIFSRR